MAEPNLEGWKLLTDYIQSICGIQLDESKHYLLASRLSGVLAETASISYGGLYHKARMDATGSVERSIIDAITTGETSFFRDQAPFELLRNKLLPALVERRKRTALGRIPIRIWSAACSTGQELYSIAIVVREVLGPTNNYDIRLIGTDISPEAVRRATDGTYNAIEASRGVGPAALARYFVQEDANWRVRPEIRALTTFRTFNLLRDFSLLGQFDIIFCRNVAIYFSERDKASLFGRMANSLAADGALLIGSTESLAGICPQLTAQTHLRSAYYEKAASGPRA